MDKFIKEQINGYNGKKYNITKIIANKKEASKYFIVTIKSNIAYADMSNDPYERKKMIVLMLSNMMEKYKVNDTTLLIRTEDGYHWENNLPVFSFSVPNGKKGVIFPNYDTDYFYWLNGAKLDKVVQSLNEYEPTLITNDIYFKGADTTHKKSKFRTLIKAESHPFNVDISDNNNEPIYKIKDHKYLLDLPGFKPWSVRFKYLMSSNRLIIRISFYNKDFGELGHWRQSYEYIFEENVDYIHLKYSFDYDKPISIELYEQIKSDILKIYNYFESNPEAYKKMVSNMNKKANEYTNEENYKYLHLLIQSYTKYLLKK
jgi:hypothetical protein